jgi:hypothetical protein
VLSDEALALSINAWLRSDEPTVYYAAALAHLSCGHLRPVNSALEVGDELSCVFCGNAAVTELELLDEPIEFPLPGSIFGDAGC